MHDEDDFFRPPAKSPVPAAIMASIVTTVVVFFALRALDERGAFPAATKRHAAQSPSASTETSPSTPAAPGIVEVPSVLGMRPEQARELLRGRDLLLAFAVERDSARYPAGTIVEQTPLTGSQIPRGSSIQAVLSRGLKQVTVPKVAGLKLEDALKLLATAELTPGPQRAIANDTMPVGIVIETDPPAGTAVSTQAPVVLVVSSGTTTKTIPKVTGMRARAARDLLEQQGFKVGKVRYDSDGDRASGVVLAQKPLATTAAPAGTIVDLTVNDD